MSVIELSERKVLNLVNVVSKGVSAEDIYNQDKHVNMLGTWLKVKGLEPFGPLIYYANAKGTDEEGKPIVKSRVMVQIKQDNIVAEYPYKFIKSLRIEGCIMCRFRGNEEDLQFATMKLQLYAYENDIELTGETYLVSVAKDDESFTDVFMPRRHDVEG